MSNLRHRVVVIGAGAFGGWTARALVRRGADVTVIDAWGPGNVRASSGGETRVIRAGYGTRTHYTALAVQALPRWRELEARIGRRIFHRTGVLWMFDDSHEAQAFAEASRQALDAHDVLFAELTPPEAAARYPAIDFNGIAALLFEPEAGYLLARRACEHVIDLVQAEGGRYRLAAARSPVNSADLEEGRLVLNDGTVMDADVFVFAGGPWLGALFPDVVGRRVTATRQEVHYFGPPAGDARFSESGMPVWIEISDAKMYGIPGNAHRGFKVADDREGPEMDPTASSRELSATGLAAARAFVARRFPALAPAPLVDFEVCQYEATPDSDLIVDRHPHAGNVWLVGGGSGHGFKLGPAVGELAASQVIDGAPVDPRFALARFAATPAGGWQAKWT